MVSREEPGAGKAADRNRRGPGMRTIHNAIQQVGSCYRLCMERQKENDREDHAVRRPLSTFSCKLFH